MIFHGFFSYTKLGQCRLQNMESSFYGQCQSFTLFKFDLLAEKWNEELFELIERCSFTQYKKKENKIASFSYPSNIHPSIGIIRNETKKWNKKKDHDDQIISFYKAAQRPSDTTTTTMKEKWTKRKRKKKHIHILQSVHNSQTKWIA